MVRLSTVGASVVGAYRGVTADLCVLGISGLSVGDGISSPYYEEALVRTAMVEAADEVVGLAVGAKLGTRGPFTVAPADDLTHLAVEPGVDEALLLPFRNRGIKVVQVGGDTGRTAVEADTSPASGTSPLRRRGPGPAADPRR